MESQESQIQADTPKPLFFEGLMQAPRLTEKLRQLREVIQVSSELQTKQTSLQEKIDRRGRQNDQALVTAIFQQSAITLPAKHREPSSKRFQTATSSKGKSFEDLRIIKPLLKAIRDVNYLKPTPIQEIAIPVISSGKDVVASSITGSGKTAAFLIPILQRFYNCAAVGYIRVLIVTPTRELAMQIYQEFEKLNKYTKIQAVLVIGASSIERQEMALRNHPQVVIGTPGRIIDVLINSRSVGIENLELIVFDEADKLLELGFQAEIKQLMSHANSEVQTVMFSATMGRDINKLAAVTTKKPIRISADPDNKTAQKLHQQIIKLKDESNEQREAVLVTVLGSLYKEKVIIFFKTKKQCHRMAIILGLLGFQACELHGNLSQTQRIQAFMDFKEGKKDILLATDLAARGLDIKQVKTVINFELPAQLTKYIHRIGRTARAGCVGTSLTISSEAECLELKRMCKKTKDKLFRVNISKEAVDKQRDTIQGMEQEIQSIQFEEHEERQIRKADMELKKLQNINEHQREIHSRPKKQWFISEAEKKNIKILAKAEAGIIPEEGLSLPEKTKQIHKTDNYGRKKNKNRKQNKGRGFTTRV